MKRIVLKLVVVFIALISSAAYARHDDGGYIPGTIDFSINISNQQEYAYPMPVCVYASDPVLVNPRCLYPEPVYRYPTHIDYYAGFSWGFWGGSRHNGHRRYYDNNSHHGGSGRRHW